MSSIIQTTRMRALMVALAVPALFGSQVSVGQSAATETLSGKELADRYCTRCHLVPEPTNLAREYWPTAMYYMSHYVGMQGVDLPEVKHGPFPPEMIPADDYNHRVVIYPQTEDYMQFFWIFKSHMVTQPMMSQEEWIRMKDYYVDNSLPRKDPRMEIRDRKEPVLKGFKPTVSNLDLEPNALVMSTRVDEKNQRIYVGRSVLDDWYQGGEALRDDLVVFDLKTGKRIGQTDISSDPIEMSLTDTGVRMLSHGEFPIAHGNGLAQMTDWEFEEGKEPKARMIIGGRHRFTSHQFHDLNGDGLKDIVTTGFGDGIWYDSGALLSVYWQTPEYSKLWQDAPAHISDGPLKGALRETVLDELAGYISSAIADINEDGKPDIVTLVAQGNHQIIIYINEGNEQFSRHVVVKNPPSFGSNNLKVKDFDGDGHLDILLVSGDSMGSNYIPGLLPSLRPKHGVRIFKNNGDLNFTEEYFYPMHGVHRSVAEDFDGDGDLDIGVIALFPNWGIEEPETFAYLENQGDLKFTASSLAREYFSVWVDIEAADVNGDNKPDIVLGLGNYPTLVPDDWLTRKVMEGRNGEAASVLYLINQH